MKRYIYLLYVFHERITWNTWPWVSWRSGRLVALFAGKSFVNALRPPGFEFSWNTLSKRLYLVLYVLATKAIGCLVRWNFLPQWDFKKNDLTSLGFTWSTSLGFLLLIRSDLFGIYVIDLFGFSFINTIWPLWDLRDRPLWVFFNVSESFLI